MKSQHTILTYSGLSLDLLAPRPEQIAIADIARGLSMTARFAGQTKLAYTVAEHSINVAGLLMSWRQPAEIVLAGLLHDAAEAYIGDATSPLKHAMRRLSPGIASPYDAIESALVTAIADRFRIPRDLFERAEVKRADLRMLAIENVDVRGLADGTVGSRGGIRAVGYPQETIERAFLVAARRMGIADA